MDNIPVFDAEKEMALKKAREKKAKREKPELQTVNVKRLHEEPAEPGDELWYNKLRGWVLIGSGVGLVFAILSFISLKFLYLAVFSPIFAAISFYFMRAFRRYSSDNDRLV